MDWVWLLVAWVSGVLTVPLVWGIITFIGWAMARTTGTGGCHVCSHGLVSEVGERANLTVWLRMWWHRHWWGSRKWHKAAWEKHWANPRRKKGAE